MRPSEHQQGFDFDWVSGPNPGYGFSSGVTVAFSRAGGPVADVPPMDEQALVAQVKQFLQQIDPETGYIAD